jgi:hypothetical protein
VAKYGIPRLVDPIDESHDLRAFQGILEISELYKLYRDQS